MVRRRRQASSMTRLGERAQKGSGESSPVVSSGLAARSAATAISAGGGRGAGGGGAGGGGGGGGGGQRGRPGVGVGLFLAPRGGGEEGAEGEVLGEPWDAAAVLEDERDGVGLEEALLGAGGAGGRG